MRSIKNIIFIIFCIFNWANATTTREDLKRKNIQIKDAYVDDRGVIILKVKYQDPDGQNPNPSFIVADTFMCFKSNCYQMESNGSEQLTNEGKFFKVRNKFVLDDTNTRAVWSVNLEDGSVPSLECPTFRKTLKNVSNDEIATLTADIQSGKTVLNSLPEESSAPKFYYEDVDKNVIYIDQTRFKIPSSYRYFEGKAGDLKEIKVKSVFVSIPGNPVITLEDGREVYVGSNTKEIKRDNKIYKSKAVGSIDITSLKIPEGDRYKFTLPTPCLETFSTNKDCASEQECNNALSINNSSKSQMKPKSNEVVPDSLKIETTTIKR